jgi:hypothetical protein
VINTAKESPFAGQVYSMGVHYFNTTAVYAKKVKHYAPSGALRKRMLRMPYAFVRRQLAFS